MKPFAVGFLLAAATSVASPSPEHDPRVLIRLEERWVDALARRDPVVVADLLADDFLDTTYKGELRDKSEVLAALTSPARADTAQRLSDLKARLYGDVGVVTGVNTVTGKDPAFTARVRFTDVFVRRAGKWRAISAQETLEESR